MSQQFEPITIVGMDDKASRQTEPRSAIVRIVLELSASAPSEWADYFNQSWRNHIYMMKRRATVGGRRLEIECVPEELEPDHLPELKKVLSSTNEAYAKYYAQVLHAKQVEASAKAAQAAKLAEMKRNIKF